MADDERPAVGTVAEEAARLLDALGGWAAARPGYAAGSAGARTEPHGAREPGEPHGAGERAEPAADEAGPQGATGAEPHPAPAGSRCESCGAENGMGQAVACQLCPVCQGIGLLRSVRPETVDRLADLAGALAATLRDIAGQRRAAAGGDPAGAAQRGPGRAGSRVQDIVVDDGDAPGSATS